MAVRVPPERRVLSEDVETTLARLERYVGRMEARYECSSKRMSGIVRDDASRCTAEIAFWLQAHRTLERLRASAGDGAGTPTRTTA